MRIWFFVFVLLGLGIAAARAISPGEQIIIFGGQATSASGGSGVIPCNGTGLIFNVACNSQYIGTL